MGVHAFACGVSIWIHAIHSDTDALGNRRMENNDMHRRSKENASRSNQFW